MFYPLQEKIGNPDLLVGREKEFRHFCQWIQNIPGRISKSRVILARRKSGKTAFIQRLFNQVWSAGGEVIPFYFDIAETKVWYPDFAFDYYRAFASQFISFLEREPSLAGMRLSLEEIGEYGARHSVDLLARDAEDMLRDKAAGLHDSVWKTASSAPHRFAGVYDRRFLVIIDEFQNIVQYVYRDEACAGQPSDTLAGSFHSLVESKYAPMLVTGSYIRWLINISAKYLEAGRLSEYYMSPCLSPESGLEAVFRYAQVFRVPVTNETAVQINTLCMADPFFISCVIQSDFEDKDLTTEAGVVDTVNYEISSRYSEMSRTWNEYIQLTLQKINDRHAKSILLFLSKHNHRYWTPKEVKQTLGLDLDVQEIQHKLMTLVEADMLEWGTADIDFRGLRDGTLNLVLRNRFEKEISDFEPDLKQEFHDRIRELKQDKRRLQELLNQVSGQVAEIQLANALRDKKRFALSRLFTVPGEDVRLNIIEVATRFPIQREDGKTLELDARARSSCGRTLLVEVKKRETKTGLDVIRDFLEKTALHHRLYPDQTPIPAVLSLGGFTEEALVFCRENGVAVRDRVTCF